MPNRLLSLLVLTLAVVLAGPLAAEESDKDAREAARERVFAFEQTLLPHVLREDGGPAELNEEQRESIRVFFAGLDTSVMKIEALSMLHQRFVYVIPEDMELSLIDPLLDDADPAVQAEALHALAYNTYGQLVFEDRVLAKAASEDPRVRSAAALVMARSGHAVYATPLNRLIDDPDAGVRADAIHAWEQWIDANRLLVLLPRTSDPDLKVAVRALSLICRQLPFITSEADRETHPGETYQNMLGVIRGHYRSLSPEEQEQFKLALKQAQVPNWFRSSLIGE